MVQIFVYSYVPAVCENENYENLNIQIFHDIKKMCEP